MMKKTLTLILAGVLLGSTVTFAAGKIFPDVPTDTWYSSAVAGLSEKGIITGYSDGTFGPTNNVNRAELAVMMDRLIEYIETGAVTPQSSSTNFFTDTDASISMTYPAYWTYTKNESNGEYAHNFSLNEIDYAFVILANGGFNKGLPMHTPETIENIVIDGKNAEKTIWKTSTNAAVGIIKFSDLPTGWTENNRIEFAVPYDKLSEVNQALSTISFS